MQNIMTINPKKLIKLAKKWQRIAASKQKRVLVARTSSAADEGHFVLYTDDKKQYVLPISYLNNFIFGELLTLSEEEFGLPTTGPITLPCDSVFMDYVISLVQRGTGKDIQQALVISIANQCSLPYSLHQQGIEQQSLICGF